MKLTKAQVNVLRAATEQHDRCLDFYQAARVGGSSSALAALVRKGLLTARRYANGQIWELTDAGRAALSEAEEGRQDG